MPITAEFEDTATIGGTEYSLPNDSTVLTPRTDDGCWEAYIDFSAITAVADEFEVKVYEKVQSGGTQRAIYSLLINRPIVVVIPSLLLVHGWDVTVRKTLGTDRSIVWSIRKISGTIQTSFEGSASISAEFSLPNNSTSLTPITTDGCYQTFIDFGALAAVADVYEVKLLEKVNSGGTQREIYPRIRVSSAEVLVLPAKLLLHGWDVTVTKISGTTRSIPWSIRQVA